MDDPENSETTFVHEDITNIIKESIESVLQNAVYSHNKVTQWTSNIVEQTLKRLGGMNKSFKYIVTCLIMQKNGAGLHAASASHWDTKTDDSCTFRWENKNMYCIVTVFGIAI